MAKKQTAKVAKASRSEQYEKTLVGYGKTIELVRKGEFEKAIPQLKELQKEAAGEDELSDRIRTYLTICKQRLAPPPPEPSTADGRYYRAVVLANNGQLEQALHLLNQSLNESPGSATLLYTRASVWALQGNGDAAVADLQQAIAIEPTLRFQATNDPDFENVRDDAAFIDVIEPTPAGA